MSTVVTRWTAGRAALGRRERSGLCAPPAGGYPEESATAVGLGPSHARSGGRLTLEQRLDSVWEGLRAGGAPACPVCQAELGALARDGVVRCGGCGSTLS